MTRVMFRLDDSDEVTAVFIDEISHHSRLEVMCYAHLGQHGSCCLTWLYGSTKPASSDAYDVLYNELTHIIGYDDLVIIHRLPSYKSVVSNIALKQAELREGVS